MTLKLKNAACGPIHAAEQLTPEALEERLNAEISRGRALLSLFAHELESKIHLCALLGDRRESTIEVLLAPVTGASYAAFTPKVPQAHYFEREIAEQYDIMPQGHPWLKPVRFHEPWRKGVGVFGKKRPGPAVWEYFSMSGPEIHEVGVGPVHAGIIEPGHFRFQCHGEDVYHLEIQLGFQHRDAERMLASHPAKRLYLAETLAGDTSIGHATAYCRLAEALVGVEPAARVDAVRAIALELERLANHVGDLGALAGDTGYLPTSSFCGRIRGDLLNITALLCGSRFGRGLLTEGGVRFAISETTAKEILKRLDVAERDTAGAINLLWQSPSVLARFEEAGRITAENARDLGLVGVAARACGLKIDARTDFTSGYHRTIAPDAVTAPSGDVYARAMVRWQEIKVSFNHIRRVLGSATGEAKVKPCGAFAPGCIAISVEEGWRGELCHAAFTNAKGEITRYKVTDPSFKNWAGLALALRGQQISDFPLCNKSFNLSYCGTDL